MSHQHSSQDKQFNSKPSNPVKDPSSVEQKPGVDKQSHGHKTEGIAEHDDSKHRRDSESK